MEPNTQYKLSVIIPGKNEEFMGRTIEDVLEHTSNQTEVIAVLDGFLPNPPLKPNSRVTVIYNPVSVGQRVATNQGAKIAKGKYIMKLDAHCSVAPGIDIEMFKAFDEVGDDATIIPLMKNFHVFDWVCENGHRRYQSPSGVCEECGEPTTKDVVWQAKASPNNVAFRFDKTMHFQYWGEYQNKHPEDLVETLSIQGSCFMCTKEKYFELGLCGEEFHSWGQQGVEVACKTWLSGGRVIANRRTWYAHLFRTRGGDFGFPYENPQDKVNENRELSRNMFQHNQWPKAIHDFQWLLNKFNPPDWDVTKGIIYYTDSKLDEKIAKPVRERIQMIAKDKNIGIVSSSLKRMEMGYKNVRFPTMKRGYLTMFKQILGALENSKDDIIFFCEHDVLYDESHFDFTPEKNDTFYYNQNVWLLRMPDGHALHYDVNQLSGLCVYRETAIKHFRERYEMTEKAYKELNEEDFNRFVRNMGFEPMTHGRVVWKNKFPYETWKSVKPNVDIKHGANATGQRWNKDQYRNQQLLINWTESEEIPGWGKGIDIVKDLM
jgi:glycosyltransferase involved in cell wall biosynthesis